MSIVCAVRFPCSTRMGDAVFGVDSWVLAGLEPYPIESSGCLDGFDPMRLALLLGDKARKTLVSV